ADGFPVPCSARDMNENRNNEHEEPAFIISVAARMLGVHAQTLRYYERAGVIEPSRSSGRIRLYSRADIERIRQVQRLIDELGVNLAGAEIIIKMSNRLRELEAENEALKREVQRYRDTRLPAKRENNYD
ncbi:MAG: helix-turn-helix transcriptional regulator, partial [Dehalococcoidia bacterium]